MAEWHSLQLNFDPFAALKPPVQTALQALEVVESVLEALLDLVKSFLLDLSNPLQSAIALLLAAVRAIISQVKSTGFAILLVHPDFSQPDFAAVMSSVSGSYPSFESKVVAKFFDTADAFRPTYPDGSTVGMMVLYIGSDSPGDLMTQLMALLALIRHPIVLRGLPAPVNLRVRPVNKSGSAVSQFRKLFDPDLDKALELEWSMPSSPSGANVPGFLNSAVSFYNSFRFPNFVIERSTQPQGETVPVQIKQPAVDTIINRFGLPPIVDTVALREIDGTQYREFATKIPVDSASGLLEGAFTGTYRYLDKDPTLVAGSTYYYRVRAYFGKPQKYLAFNGAASVAASASSGGLLHYDNNLRQWFITYGDGVVMGSGSATVKGFVPRPLPSNQIFNAYTDVYDAVRAAILLNFEFPPASSSDSSFQRDQKTGWGTLSVAGGQIGPLKAAFPDSNKLKNSAPFKVVARRIANQAILPLRSKPAMLDLIGSKWAGGAQEVVRNILDTKRSWRFIGVVGGFTRDASPSEVARTASTPTAQPGVVQTAPLPNQNVAPTPTKRINSYLALEAGYHEGQPFTGPFPVRQVGNDFDWASVDQRQDLADFLHLTLAAMSGQVNYMSWYSVTIGDLFPAFIPFLNDFEQFMLAMMNAVKSALQEIEDIIQTIIQKIQALEQVLATILSLLDMLNINVSLSVLLVGPKTNGSAASLAQDLISSTKKPSSDPFGLHSGLVMAFGGPGQGSVAALEALKFLLTVGH